MRRTLLVVGFPGLLAAAVIAGCSSSTEMMSDARSAPAIRDSAAQVAHDIAVQHFVDGSMYEMKGEYAQAVLEYQDAIRYEPDDAIYFALSKCYAQLGKHSLAIENGEKAVRLAPDKIEYRRNLANAYVGAYELDSAAHEYEEIVKRDPNTIENWYSLARLYQVRNPQKALKVFEEIRQRFGGEWDVLLQIAELYNQMGQFDKAASAMRQKIGRSVV